MPYDVVRVFVIIGLVLLLINFGAIDTSVAIAYWPQTHPWADLIAIPSKDGDYVVEIVASPVNECKPDPEFGPCDDDQKAKYRYVSASSLMPSRRFQYVESQSSGHPPESPFGVLFVSDSNLTWAEHYKIQDREYVYAVLAKSKDSLSWVETGDTLRVKWTCTGALGEFGLKAEMIRKAVGVNYKNVLSGALSRRIVGVRTKIAVGNPLIDDKYSVLGRSRSQ